MSDIIYHHYPQSPVSEKVRIGFGIKGLHWQSVEIPRLPPKPDLMPLTGGYRRTPVMQIGADIYCDSACIMAALEEHAPTPSFFPAGPGRGKALCRWVESNLLDGAIRIVLCHDPKGLPEAFAQDRGRLYFGPDHDLAAIHKSLGTTIAQMAGQLEWMDQWLSAGNPFLEADQPAQADAFVYYILWFLRWRWPGGPGFIEQFPALTAWESRMTAIGHGTQTPLEAQAALDIAQSATSKTTAEIMPYDPEGLELGMSVEIVPEGDGGDPPVLGQLQVATRNRLAILYKHERVGEVCIHFPRVGYRVFKR